MVEGRERVGYVCKRERERERRYGGEGGGGGGRNDWILYNYPLPPPKKKCNYL